MPRILYSLLERRVFFKRMSWVLILSAVCICLSSVSVDGWARPSRAAGTNVDGKASAPKRKPVDINKASRKQLMTLPGIDAKTAERIIAARPYYTKVELVTRKLIPEGTYLSLRREIIASQDGSLPPKDRR
jgi:hypothetical protein